MSIKCDILCFIQQKINPSNKEAIIESLIPEIKDEQIESAIRELSAVLKDDLPAVRDGHALTDAVQIFCDASTNGVEFPEYTTSNVDFIASVSKSLISQSQKDTNEFLLSKMRELKDSVEQIKADGDVQMRVNKAQGKQIQELQATVRQLRGENSRASDQVVQGSVVQGQGCMAARAQPEVQHTTYSATVQSRNAPPKHAMVPLDRQETPVFLTGPSSGNARNDDAGWQQQKPARKRYRDADTVIGKANPPADQTPSITGVKAKTSIFAFRISKGTGEEKVKGFLEGKNIAVHECTRVSNDAYQLESYFIVIDKDKEDDVLNQEFWPQYVACRKWIGRRPRSLDLPPNGEF